MSGLQELLATVPEPAKDLRLNLERVLAEDGGLTPAQAWGTALAAALTAGHEPLTRALAAAAAERVTPAVLADAQAAAALMGMSNVYYRFRHLVGKEDYARLPARLRMVRLGKPAGEALDFELFCLAVSALNGCETCVRGHEAKLRQQGASVERVHDAVRVAAIVQGVATALGARHLVAEAA